MKKLMIALIVTLFALPFAGLLAVPLLLSPAALAACQSAGQLVVTEVPDKLTAVRRDGASVTLGRRQLTHAATIITVGSGVEGVGRAGVVIGLMAALTESTLRMLANPTHPTSLNMPNDGVGRDHDSLGLFQMRPTAGWGTVDELMDPDYQVRAFFGGSSGPNFPSPAGLLDIPGWQAADPGTAAQSVERSAFPDRYQDYQPVAEAILAALTKPAAGAADGGPPLRSVPETTRFVFPLPSGTWVRSSGYGWRTDPLTGDRAFHSGTDFSAADGTPIFAAADGIVGWAGPSPGYGHLVVIEHTIGGKRVASAYAHMWASGIYVSEGERVTAGQHIADVGASGKSTGSHLHFEIRPGGSFEPSIDADPWFVQHGAEGQDASTSATALCAIGLSG
ncbi:M23 family metallopeptidase [Microbacterium sp. zg.Y625]|uniref:M23 family metallopeptidase n=1 Tax=Microbacterium jiangjiandongii TaxID=3049071 RepID=UPI00214CE4B7|nr:MULTISPECIES: M23 family metallopeptidase [unclassified Microbacterium]MCR2792763.1 M23 family metallopeptidase [Microbacterium sp. zg.Y625]WIM26740.1 M23 family metallopeptidase [Microbacterium sp. zg-Y625]